ncbi:hypothetical protein [Rubrivivax rivuli]|uniref:Uncharacterized protein n=1 Tax=Rubrivivax rivuli TaxID=1862385 RepID=A0A437RGR9_9BURK|nr:hypothetical protein [Rubrivivax rivuli]RVU45951.1 hypothetical protein EOE66_08720 [Rubrivivax rivuli]
MPQPRWNKFQSRHRTAARAVVGVALLACLTACGGGQRGGDSRAQAAAAAVDADGVARALAVGSRATANANAAEVTVTGLIIVSQTPISTTHEEIVLRVKVRNASSAPWANGALTVQSAARSTRPAGDRVEVPFLPLQSTVETVQTLSVRNERAVPFNPAVLRWTFSGAPVAQVPVTPDNTGIPDRSGVAVQSAGATIIGLESAAGSPQTLSIEVTTPPEVAAEKLVGAAVVRFHNISTTQAVGVFRSPSAAQRVHECDLELTECRRVHAAYRLNAQDIAFPINADRLYAVQKP